VRRDGIVLRPPYSMTTLFDDDLGGKLQLYGGVIFCHIAGYALAAVRITCRSAFPASMNRSARMADFAGLVPELYWLTPMY